MSGYLLETMLQGGVYGLSSPAQKCRRIDFYRKLHALLRYLCKKQATSYFTQSIDELVETTKNNEKLELRKCH